MFLTFATSIDLVRVPAGALVCITADGNYSTIFMADSSEHVVTLQLGQIERRIAELIGPDDNRFIRIGKSLIVNRDYICYINAPRQRLVLSDSRTFRRELSASRDALKALKEYFEKENL